MNININHIRNKPFIVICGCTGTGKTKLSIQLAEWLISIGKKSEIINADAMQTYQNLDIITNKATKDEMKCIKHHLLGYLEPTCITSNVIDYKNKVVDLIDSLLKNDIIPILVGGTHYYIQSVIWDILIDKNDSNQSTNKNNLDLIIKPSDSNSNIVKLIFECSTDDLNVKLHDSNISTEDIYKELERVDLQSAQKIHPNDRRKLCRALQIYYTHGVTKTDLLDMKNKETGTNMPLRYKNVCMFAMNCENEVLNKRLDDRVDQMIKNGLLNELDCFKKEFESKVKNQTFKEYSKDFEFGIFQSIGFKEFDGYFKYLDEKNNQIDNDNFEKNKKQLFDQAVIDMKISTRRYAKTQIRWVKNRFIKRALKNSPIVYELDTTNLNEWEENIFNKSSKIFEDYLNRYEANDQVELNLNENETSTEEIFEFNKCEICDKIFVNKFQFECHMKSSGHKKRKESLKRKEFLKLVKQIDLIKEQKEIENKNSILNN